jgi:hypothetical protein
MDPRTLVPLHGAARRARRRPARFTPTQTDHYICCTSLQWTLEWTCIHWQQCAANVCTTPATTVREASHAN